MSARAITWMTAFIVMAAALGGCTDSESPPQDSLTDMGPGPLLDGGVTDLPSPDDAPLPDGGQEDGQPSRDVPLPEPDSAPQPQE